MMILKIAHIKTLHILDKSVLSFELTRNRCSQIIPTVIALNLFVEQTGPVRQFIEQTGCTGPAHIVLANGSIEHTYVS